MSSAPLPRGVLIGIVVAGAVVVVAIVAVVALVLPSLIGGSPVASTATIVADIATKPQPTWRYDWVGSSDSKYLEGPNVAEVGDHDALVWSTFDVDSWNDSQPNSEGWYEGYDDQYTAGYAAGQKYNTDFEAWEEDFTGEVSDPDSEDYYPSGEYDNPKFLGFANGFDDAVDDSKGAHQLVKPVDPKYTPTVTMVDVSTGKKLWSVDLSDAVHHASYSSTFTAIDVPGSDAVAVTVDINADSGDTTTLVTLNRSTGKVLASLDSTGPVQTVPYKGSLFVSTSGKNGKDPVVSKYSADSLSHPSWRTDLDSLDSLKVVGDYIVATGDDDGEAIDPSTGKSAKWGGDIDKSTSYALVGSSLIRQKATTSDSSTSYRIEGYDDNGQSTWDDSVEADAVFSFPGALFTADTEKSTVRNLERIDPTNGKELWTDSYDESFQTVIGVTANNVLLYNDDKVIVLNLSDGREVFAQTVDQPANLFTGSTSYYVPTKDELVAYSYAQKGIVWRYDLDSGETVIAIGKQLAVVNPDKGTLRGLKGR